LKIPFSETQPNLVAIAGPNGAGKSTFYKSHLSEVEAPFINADVIALEMDLHAYAAAEIAETARRGIYERRESFIFETVFSDPVGGKLAFLEEAAVSGYHVVLCFVGVSRPEKSLQRVGIRVLEGGHDVPTDKVMSRYPRVMENLRLAMLRLPLVLVYDNDDLREPHRFCAAVGMGVVMETSGVVPEWLDRLLPS
jgi:predicted ABC-type ATPase